MRRATFAVLLALLVVAACTAAPGAPAVPSAPATSAPAVATGAGTPVSSAGISPTIAGTPAAAVSTAVAVAPAGGSATPAPVVGASPQDAVTPTFPPTVRPEPPTQSAATDREQELARALANAPPKRDLVDIARRFKAVPSVVATASPEASTVGQTRTFWVADSARKRYFEARARLARKSAHVDFYVEEGQREDDAAIDRSLDQLEKNLLPTIVQHFGGSKIDVDHLRISILYVRTPGVVGYFSSIDEYPKWVAQYSNERPLIAMNIQAVQPGTRAFESGLAHELEHLIQFRLDPGEETWVNEGTAELAIRAAGLDPSGNYQAFLPRPDTQLNQWAEDTPQTPPHYGAAFLFFTYLADRFGGYDVIGEFLARPERGIAGIDPVLKRVSGGKIGFDGAFDDWIVANWANQRDDEGRYGYKELTQARVSEESIGAVPTKVSATVHQYAAHYYRLPRDAAGANLTVTAPADAKLIGAPDRAHQIWWSNRTDSADSRLTRELDLSGQTKATLRFSTWYDLERDYDYTFVTASTDGGKTWKTLPGKNTTTSDPNGANLGAGFTGKSGGGSDAKWVDEEVDLTPYAGKKLQLRFEMITDDAYNGAGFAFDGAEVPELGWKDTGDGWQAEGFVRIANKVPQRLAARVVAVTGKDVRVLDVPIGPNGQGRLALPRDLSGAERVALVVAAQTPLTIEPAPFEITFEKAA